jgi:2-hydroxy-4-carboxymuconate semialdehyde hemiacetal dehydrogenase
MKVILAGAGAFGVKHLEAMARIPGIEVVSLVSPNPETTAALAQQWKIPHHTHDLGVALS